MHNGHHLLFPGIRVTPSDRLTLRSQVSINTAITLRLRAMLMLDDGRILPFDLDQVSPATGVRTTSLVLTDGYLLSCVLTVLAGTVERGEVYSAAQIRSYGSAVADISHVLFEDYVDSQRNIQWPLVQSRATREGPGDLRVVLVTDPAAGSDWTATVPDGAQWRVQAIRAQLATSATVANRRVSLRSLDGSGNELWRVHENLDITASQTSLHTWSERTPISSNANTVVITAPLPWMIYPNAFQLASVTANLQAGDAWTAIRITVEEWFVNLV